TSGTLAYAMGAGKAVVSTPFLHAEEMLADGRGKLFPFNDAEVLASTVLDLLHDRAALNALGEKAYSYSRSMTWSQVGLDYRRVASEVLQERQHNPRIVQLFDRDAERISVLPDLKLDHLRTLTDDTGILQHAIYTVPNRIHGYCTDDNARALVVAMLY